MLAIVTLLVVVLLSLTVVRVATVALVLTGVSRPVARFQARSAFTGCGFATAESEQIVNHPVRRKIVGHLMFLGPAGIVATAGAVVAGIVGVDSGGWPFWVKGLTLLAGLGLLVWFSNSAVVDRVMGRWIEHALRRYTSVDARDYAKLLHISGDYGLGEMLVKDDDWLAGRTLADLRLSNEGVLILGIDRPGAGYVGAPASSFTIRPGDTLILYARSGSLADLDRRRRGIRGALAHADAVAEHKARSERETAGAERTAAREAAQDAARAAGPVTTSATTPGTPGTPGSSPPSPAAPPSAGRTSAA